MPVPPLRHRILHTGKCRIALGMTDRNRDGEAVDDVENRHDHDEGHEVPVRHVDVRLLAASQRAQIEDEIGDPHDIQPDIGIPFRLGIFLRLRNAHQVAGCGDDAEQVVAKQDEPRGQLVRQARTRGSLHHIEGRGDQRIAAEAEDHAGGVHRTEAAEARPGGVECQVRIDELPGDPVADEKSSHDPDHRQDNAHSAGVVEISIEAVFAGLRCVVSGDDAEGSGDPRQQYNRPVNAERITLSSHRHGKSTQGNRQQDNERKLSLVLCQLSDHELQPL